MRRSSAHDTSGYGRRYCCSVNFYGSTGYAALVLRNWWIWLRVKLRHVPDCPDCVADPSGECDECRIVRMEM